MASGSFTIYTGNDFQGPGLITGGTGSLINILDYVLVGGYGTGSYYKAPAGWTKPFPNSGSTATTPLFGCWRQGGGSSMSLFMNDGGQALGAQGKEAWITGWENITSIAPTGTGSLNVGQGYGQFPTPAQENTYGYCVIRKSDDATSGRYWMIAADATTCYMWIWAEAATDGNRCYHWMFGDIYSLAGAADVWKCSIYGRVVNNNAQGQSAGGATLRDYTELMPAAANIGSTGNYLTIVQPGHYLARNGFGYGTSLGYAKHGDSQFQVAESLNFAPNPACNQMQGSMQPTNGADNLGYIVPLEVVEARTTYVSQRGKLRGLYHPMTSYTNFTNGQIISGSGEFTGKTFMAIRYSYGGSCWLLEISPTVDTN